MNHPRLISLSIIGRSNMLEMSVVHFGEFLTTLIGENGSGKTAVMRSLFWALGGSRRPEEPIWSDCAEVRLELKSSTGLLATVSREFSERFQASIRIEEQVRAYDDEASFSAAILSLLGIPNRTWTNRAGNGSVPAYMGVILPAFAIDQDKGWQAPYAPYDAKSFVKDQEEEVSRLLLRVDARHIPERDKERDGFVRKLERLKHEAEIRDAAIKSLAREAERVDGRGLDTLRATRERLLIELRSFDSVVTAFAEANAGMRARLEEARVAHDVVQRELTGATQHRAALDRLLRDVTSDLDVVESNDIAAQAFRRHCGNATCDFFQGRDLSASYGRRVLYLRDQLKDLATAMSAGEGRVATLQAQLASAAERLRSIRSDVESLASASPASRISASVDSMSKELASVGRGIAVLEEIDAERSKRLRILEDREAVAENLKNHDKVRTVQAERVGAMRKRVEDSIPRWLEVLHANDFGVVGIGDDFRVTIKGKTLNDQRGPSGSTRSRLMLAVHAARLEASLDGGGAHPGFLLFDAPKQQELKPDHFDEYIGQLRQLAARHPGKVQVVVSSRTPMPTEELDRVWTPQYRPLTGEDHMRFLGPRPNR